MVEKKVKTSMEKVYLGQAPCSLPFAFCFCFLCFSIIYLFIIILFSFSRFTSLVSIYLSLRLGPLLYLGHHFALKHTHPLRNLSLSLSFSFSLFSMNKIEIMVTKKKKTNNKKGKSFHM